MKAVTPTTDPPQGRPNSLTPEEDAVRGFRSSREVGTWLQGVRGQADPSWELRQLGAVGGSQGPRAILETPGPLRIMLTLLCLRPSAHQQSPDDGTSVYNAGLWIF